MLTRLRALIHRLHDLAEIDALTEAELSDLGLSRSQLRELVAIPAEVPDRVARMAAVFGLTERSLQENRTDYLELLGTCQHCRDAKACTRKMEAGEIRAPEDAGFCPNAPSYNLSAAFA